VSGSGLTIDHAPGAGQNLFVQMGAGVARNADVVDLLNPDSRRAQAILDRLSGKSGAVLDAIEALFFDGANQLTVFDERGGRITVICIDAEDVHDYLKRCC